MDLCKAFSDALIEEGMDAEVSHSKINRRQADEFRVVKEINGDVYRMNTVMTFPVGISDSKIKQRIAVEATSMARNIRSDLRTRVEWQDSAVEFDQRGEHSVTCLRCSSEVSVDDLRDQSISAPMAEASVPNPTTPELASLGTVKIQMALLALLRDECEVYCENSPYDPLNHRNL